MKKTVIAAISASLFLGCPSLAQMTERDRAQAAVNGMGPVTDQITQGNMVNTITPFVTATPPEASLTEPNFDAAELAIRTGTGVDGRAYSATVDSALNRPAVTMPPTALNLADSAIGQADAVVGGLFSANSGTCSAIFQGGSYNGLKICQSILSRRLETCQETRNISVDRDDTWSCTVENATYRKQCQKSITWSCTGSQNGTCRKQAISFTPAPVWNAQGTSADVSFGPVNNGQCSIRTHTIYLRTADYMNMTAMSLAGLTFQGVAQIRVNGVNVWTFGTAATGNLAVGNRSCGKRCSRRAIYAGSTWIQDCGTATVISRPMVDILPSLTVAALGPSTNLNTPPVTVATGSLSTQVRIDILTGNNSETSATAQFQTAGQCCSAFTANLGGAC